MSDSGRVFTSDQADPPVVALVNASGMTEEDKQRVRDLFADMEKDRQLKQQCFDQLAEEYKLPAEQRVLLLVWFGYGFDYCRHLQREGK